MKSKTKIANIAEYAIKLYGKDNVSVYVCDDKAELRADIESITTINIKGFGMEPQKGIYVEMVSFREDLNAISTTLIDYNAFNFKEDRFKRIYFSHYPTPSIKYLSKMIKNLDFIFSLAMNMKKMDEFEKENF